MGMLTEADKSVIVVRAFQTHQLNGPQFVVQLKTTEYIHGKSVSVARIKLSLCWQRLRAK